jgi:hypothetical protein
MGEALGMAIGIKRAVSPHNYSKALLAGGGAIIVMHCASADIFD